MREFNTTAGLILSKSSAPKSSDTAQVLGYATVGDGGGGVWKHNGVIGQTVSQSPIQLTDALLNDASGNQWALIAPTEINPLQLGAKYDDLTDDSTAHNAGLAALNAAGGGVLRLPPGTTRANIVNTFDNVGIVGSGRATIISPTSGVCLTDSSITGDAGSHIHNFACSGANGAATGILTNNFSQGKYGDLWLTDSLDIGLDVNGDGESEITFGNVSIVDPVNHGVRYLRTNGTDTGGVYFDTLAITGSVTTGVGIEISSTHTSRSKALVVINKLIIDNRAAECVLLNNVTDVNISQLWAEGTITGKGMVYVQDVAECLINQATLNNSHASGYDLIISGGAGSDTTTDFSINQLRTAGAGVGVQYTSTPTITRCNIAQWNDTSGTQTNDTTRLASMRGGTVEGIFNRGSEFLTLTIATDAITITSSAHRLTPESGTTDDLTTINGGTQGDRLTMTVDSSSNTITVKHGTGNIYLDSAADKSLDNVRDKIELVYQNSEWHQVSFSSNG